MKKLLVCLLAAFMIILSGCSNNNGGASTSSEGGNFLGTSATQGIAIGDVTGNNDREKMVIAATQALSEVKGARKDFLDEYFKNNKEVKSYDKWIGRIDGLSEKVSNTISTVSALQPPQNAEAATKNAFTKQRDNTVSYLQSLSTVLAVEKSKVQNSKSSSKPISRGLLSSSTINKNCMVDYSRMNKSIEYNGVNMMNFSKHGLSAQIIPKYDIIFNYLYTNNVDDSQNAEITSAFTFLNPWEKDFDLSKLKIVLLDNGKEVVGDANAMNPTISNWQRLMQGEGFPYSAAPNGKLDLALKSSGKLNPKEVALYAVVFKGLSRNMFTPEGIAESEILIYYGDELIWVGDYLDSTALPV